MIQQLFDPHNRLFSLVKTGKRQPPIVLAVILAVIFTFGGQLIGAFPYAILLLLDLLPSGSGALSSALHQLIFFTLTLTPTGILLFFWLMLVERRRFSSLGFEKPGWLMKFGRGLLLGTALFLGVVLLMALPGYIQRGTPAPPPALLAVLIILPGWILQGSLEEVVLRGWLMPVIGVRSHPWLGVLLSSLLFAILHLLNPAVTPLAVLNLVLAGLLFALVALWEGGLWGACALHAAWNWTQGSLLSFPVSGNLLQGPTWLTLSENGPDLVTGGAFGPEGGMATTLVYLAACGVFIYLIQRKQRNNP